MKGEWMQKMQCEIRKSKRRPCRLNDSGSREGAKARGMGRACVLQFPPPGTR
ncbi:hypothetical protein BS47DRAFT_1339511 [Hydnum rufescens UP504]|uniref:Uncharacterized protein n=1 Tax=Hydnum rufescens UP504 TaxID=1448309 RepID=A0A9P6B4G9_9AGAM|nr:hypothetical protein BS47DRAFT_1339511 [Hydnum rufescens UP504]